MKQVEPHLKIKGIIFISKKNWLENPGRESLVSERSLRKLRPLGRLLSQWVACELYVVLLFDLLAFMCMSIDIALALIPMVFFGNVFFGNVCFGIMFFR